jgi:hypothetical protein
MGGDTVGMSTVPEIVAAHHCGIKVLCLSLVTNKVIIGGDEGPAASHAEVLEAVGERAIQMQALVKEILVVLKKTVLPTMDELPPVDLKVPRKCSTNWEYMGIPMHCILSTGVIVLTVSALFGTRLVKIKA